MAKAKAKTKKDDYTELMKYCPHCGHKIKTSIGSCPACKYNIVPIPVVIAMLITYLLSAAAIIAVVLFVFIVAAGFILWVVDY